MKEMLDAWLSDGKITQEEYDAAIARDPSNAAAWTALSAELAKANADRDAAIERERAKDEIIRTFTTAPNDNITADIDPLAAAVEYVNKKRGIN